MSSNKGGTCLLSCSSENDCRAGYKCDQESDEEGGGQSMVCSGE